MAAPRAVALGLALASSAGLVAPARRGHHWPGVAGPDATRLTGRHNRDIQATEVIWGFFARHRRR